MKRLIKAVIWILSAMLLLTSVTGCSLVQQYIVENGQVVVEDATETANTHIDEPKPVDAPTPEPEEQTEEDRKEEQYQEALSLYRAGSYAEARERFSELSDYQDSDVYVIRCDLLPCEERDIVKFGSYPQTADEKEEPIEWIVLDKEKDRILLLSKYIIDAKPYHQNKKESVTWATCSLRKWLNNQFYEKAFSETEQQAILLSNVPAEKTPTYETKAGKDTQDHVFLLSAEDALKYLDGTPEAKTTKTDYANLPKNSDNLVDITWYWLRSPGRNNEAAAAMIHHGGHLFEKKEQEMYGHWWDCDVWYPGGVRPALWIDLGSYSPTPMSTPAEDPTPPPEPDAQTEEDRKEEQYQEALSLYRAGSYADARARFSELSDYKDSGVYVIRCDLMPCEERDIVKFGSYPQSADGKEAPIEWIVLDKDDDRILVISKYVLDCQQYHTKPTDYSLTWEDCNLRAWLNGTFLNTAFSSEEQKCIIRSEVTADRNPYYVTSPGNDTMDQVFLLSITEVDCYIRSLESRKCAPTKFAIAQGVHTSDEYTTEGRATCWWWLRTPGEFATFAADVEDSGALSKLGGASGDRVESTKVGVRPALWIDLG